jgi:tRNA G18 (ribose-2'-O)-methylase SpoU
MRKLQHHEIPRADPAEAKALPKHPIHVVADNIRSIHNVGSLFRTSDAAGIAHLHLCGFTATPDDRRLYKTALGAQDVVEWSYHQRAEEAVRALKADGFTIAALEITDAPRDIEDLEASDFPLALLIGNEVEGVANDLIQLCDFAIEIPQYGIKQSLNVSVAFGVAAVGLVRQYRQLNGMHYRAVAP